MASVGKASLTIVPKFDGLSRSVINYLKGIDTSSAGVAGGEQYSSGFEKGSSGLLKSGALVGVFSEVTRKAMDIIGGSVDAAASRLDTLNNYPRVLESLGASSDEAEASISLMSERLQGLPTALNDMASTTQGIYAITKDLDQSTRASIALNDMLLAGGQSQQVVNAATEQFRQILARGKPELEDWKALVNAAPGQMDQLAKSMLGPTATANDLYAALGGGKNEAIFSMDDLLGKIIELDEQGGEGFKSFEEQARAAISGVNTGAANMGTAIARGVTDVMDSIGSENITDAMSGVGSAFEDGLGVVADVAGAATPVVKDFVKGLSEIAPVAISTAGAVAVVSGAGGAIETVAAGARSLGKAFTEPSKTGKALSNVVIRMADGMKEGSKAQSGLLSVASRLGSLSAGPLALGIGLAAAATANAVSEWQKAEEKQRKVEKATYGLSDAMRKASPEIAAQSTTVDGLGVAYRSALGDIDAFLDKQAEYVDRLNEINETSSGDMARLEDASQTISELGNRSDLSAEQQGRLAAAIETVNSMCGTEYQVTDLANGALGDTAEAAASAKDEILKLVDAKKQEIEANALMEKREVLFEAQQNALSEYNKKLADYNLAWSNAKGSAEEAISGINQMVEDGIITEEEAAARRKAAWDEVVGAVQPYQEELDIASDAMNTAESELSNLDTELGINMAAMDGSASATDRFLAKAGHLTNALDFSVAVQNGVSNPLEQFRSDLENCGFSIETFERLNDEQLSELGIAYDGTIQSITGKLFEFAETDSEVAELVKGDLAGMTEVMMQFASDTQASLDGIDVESLTVKLAEAGVSTETLNAIGAENFAALATSCNGNIDAMVAAIAGYNTVPLLDKDGHVQVSYATLQDAQGNILQWNKDHLEDLDGNAIVDDRELVDAQGNLYTWNGSTLESKEADAEVDGNLKEANTLKSQWNDGDLLDKYATAYITIQQNGNAAGGIRLNAAGGVRYHADGAFIATRAMPLDIVGEAGAEAIVPLTNKRYSQPFVDLVADGVNERDAPQLERLVTIGRQIVRLLESIQADLPEGIDIMDLKRMGVGS